MQSACSAKHPSPCTARAAISRQCRVRQCDQCSMPLPALVAQGINAAPGLTAIKLGAGNVFGKNGPAKPISHTLCFAGFTVRNRTRYKACRLPMATPQGRKLARIGTRLSTPLSAQLVCSAPARQVLAGMLKCEGECADLVHHGTAANAAQRICLSQPLSDLCVCSCSVCTKALLPHTSR